MNIKQKIESTKSQEEKTKYLNEYIFLEIVKTNIPFYFKGGTSIQWSREYFNRVSQDIDIAISNDEEFNLNEILSLEGISVEKVDDDEGQYGIGYNIYFLDATTMLDVSKYNSFDLIEHAGVETFQLNGVAINIFPIINTFTEKLFAMHSWAEVFTTWNRETPSIYKRYLRHFQDVSSLFNKEDTIINAGLSIKKHVARVTMSNELKHTKFQTTKFISDFMCFDTENLKLIKDVYERWEGDTYLNDGVKQTFETIEESLAEIKIWGQEVLVNKNL